MPEISIIIVNYNTKDFIVNCINSIKKSGIKNSFEIIVVDNGSIDGSVEVLKKLKGIIFIANKINLGFAKANNQGIKKAKGKYILLLNSDTKVKKGAIDKLLKFAEENVDVGVVGPMLLNKNGSIQPSTFRLPTVGRTIRQYWLGDEDLLDKFVPSGKKPVEVDMLVMAALLLTPEAIKKVGLLDERYFMFFEDMDHARRLMKAKLKVFYLPDAKVVHYHGQSGKDNADKLNQWRRLIPSSKIYHGLLKHYLIWFIMRVSQLFKK